MSAWGVLVDWFDGTLDTSGLDAVRAIGLASFLAGMVVMGIMSLFPNTETVDHVGAAALLVVTSGVAALVWKRYRLVKERVRQTGVPTRSRETS